MKKLKDFIIKFIKENKKFVISVSILLIGQAFLYWFLKLFQKDPIYIYYYLDDVIPFLGRFVYIYNSFYPFMLISLYFLYKCDEKAYYKGIISGVIGFLICDIIFLSVPTIMYRPIIPKYDFITDLVIKITFLYDSPPLNCFPSIHCLFSFQVMYSYLFSKYDKKKKWVFISYAFLVAISTLFIKQHYIYDVISAFLICLISNLLCDLFRIYDFFKRKKII